MADTTKTLREMMEQLVDAYNSGRPDLIEKHLDQSRAWLAAQAQAEPVVAFDDPRVATVYTILCNTDDMPPPKQHWEGWTARRIIDALTAETREGQRLNNAEADIRALQIKCAELAAQMRSATDVTLRDKFAMAALAGISAHTQGAQRRDKETQGEADARWALGVADAILKARDKK